MPGITGSGARPPDHLHARLGHGQRVNYAHGGFSAEPHHEQSSSDLVVALDLHDGLANKDPGACITWRGGGRPFEGGLPRNES